MRGAVLYGWNVRVIAHTSIRCQAKTIPRLPDAGFGVSIGERGETVLHLAAALARGPVETPQEPRNQNGMSSGIVGALVVTETPEGRSSSSAAAVNAFAI